MTTVAPQEPPAPHAPTAPPIAADAPDDRDRYASWVRRVIAWLLDAAVVATVSFVGAGRFAATLGWIPWPGGQDAASVPATSWALGASAVLLALQAWTGHTPGKRAVHVAVVRSRDGRPLGLLTTVAREVLHLVDAFLMIGFLRPLWHRRRRTFADSIVGSDVVVGRPAAPLPWVAWLRARVGRRLVTPEQVTAAATAICLVALAAAVLPARGASGGAVWTCGGAPLAPDAARPALAGARLGSATWSSERRLGITRSHLVDPATITWRYAGNPTALTAQIVSPGRQVDVRVDLGTATATVDDVPARVRVLSGWSVGVSAEGGADADAARAVVTLPGSVDLRDGVTLLTAAIEPATGAASQCVRATEAQ